MSCTTVCPIMSIDEVRQLPEKVLPQIKPMVNAGISAESREKYRGNELFSAISWWHYTAYHMHVSRSYKDREIDQYDNEQLRYLLSQMMSLMMMLEPILELYRSACEHNCVCPDCIKGGDYAREILRNVKMTPTRLEKLVKMYSETFQDLVSDDAIIDFVLGAHIVDGVSDNDMRYYWLTGHKTTSAGAKNYHLIDRWRASCGGYQESSESWPEAVCGVNTNGGLGNWQCRTVMINREKMCVYCLKTAIINYHIRGRRIADRSHPYITSYIQDYLC